MEELKLLREDLAQCDEILLNTLIMRNRIVEQIMAVKEKNGLAIIQPDQEKKQAEHMAKALEGVPHQKEIRDVFNAVYMNSKRIQARKLFDYNILLIGFMGAGKTTISNYLNLVFNMDVAEMDQIISQREGMSIPDIFEEYGEEYFRNAETELLRELRDKKNTVISCGGGTPMRTSNHAEMKKIGKVVLLTATPETILERLKDDHSRPLLENNKKADLIARLMEKRRPSYEAVADIIIKTDGKTRLQICEELVRKLQE